MEQLPISTHIAVVSHSGGKSPVSNANTLPEDRSEGSFADRLAAQIDAQGASVLAPGAPLLQAEAPEMEAISPNVEAQAEAPSGAALSAAFVSLLSIAPPVERALAAGKADKSEVQSPLVARVAAALTPENGTPQLLGLKADVPSVAATKADESAIIAVADKALPSKNSADFDALLGKQPLAAFAPLAPRADAVSSSAPASTYVPLTVDVKVGAPGWDTAFSQRVTWAATNQQQVAELRLNPPNLGPVEIRITVTNDQATAMFVSAHASVRDSIEAALPRLRETLAESGLTLGNVNVSSQSFHQHQQAGQDDDKSKSLHGDATPAQTRIPLVLINVQTIAMRRNGLVDIFA